MDCLPVYKGKRYVSLEEIEKVIKNKTKAYLVVDKADRTSAIHEIFTHPFLINIEKTNNELYENLLKEAKSNTEIVEWVNKHYGEATDVNYQKATPEEIQKYKLAHREWKTKSRITTYSEQEADLRYEQLKAVLGDYVRKPKKVEGEVKAGKPTHIIIIDEPKLEGFIKPKEQPKPVTEKTVKEGISEDQMEGLEKKWYKDRSEEDKLSEEVNAESNAEDIYYQNAKDKKNVSKGNIDHEYIARAIDLISKGKLEANKSLKEKVVEFLKELSNYVKKLFKLEKIHPEDLDANMTLEELTNFVVNNKEGIALETKENETNDANRSVNIINKNFDTFKMWWNDKSISKNTFWEKLQKVTKLSKTQIDLLKKTYEELRGIDSKRTITQDENSYYRGQIEKPYIDDNGNLILEGRKDDLYAKAGMEEKGISATEDLNSAIEYGIGKLEVEMNLASESYDRETELDRLTEGGYWLIQIPKTASNKIITEAGEVKIVEDKLIIPKGQYKLEHITEKSLNDEAREIRSVTLEEVIFTVKAKANGDLISPIKTVEKEIDSGKIETYAENEASKEDFVTVEQAKQLEEANPFPTKSKVDKQTFDKQSRSLKDNFKKLGVESEIIIDTSINECATVDIVNGKAIIKYNPIRARKDSLFHEYGHVYIDLLGYNDSFVQRGIDQLRNTNLWNKIEAIYKDVIGEHNPRYKELLEKEVLSTALGIEADKIFRKVEEIGRFKFWLNRFFDRLARKLGLKEQDKIAVVKELAYQLYKGKLINKKTGININRESIKQYKQISNRDFKYDKDEGVYKVGSEEYISVEKDLVKDYKGLNKKELYETVKAISKSQTFEKDMELQDEAIEKFKKDIILNDVEKVTNDTDLRAIFRVLKGSTDQTFINYLATLTNYTGLTTSKLGIHVDFLFKVGNECRIVNLVNVTEGHPNHYLNTFPITGDLAKVLKGSDALAVSNLKASIAKMFIERSNSSLKGLDVKINHIPIEIVDGEVRLSTLHDSKQPSIEETIKNLVDKATIINTQSIEQIKDLYYKSSNVYNKIYSFPLPSSSRKSSEMKEESSTYHKKFEAVQKVLKAHDERIKAISNFITHNKSNVAIEPLIKTMIEVYDEAETSFNSFKQGIIYDLAQLVEKYNREKDNTKKEEIYRQFEELYGKEENEVQLSTAYHKLLTLNYKLVKENADMYRLLLKYKQDFVKKTDVVELAFDNVSDQEFKALATYVIKSLEVLNLIKQNSTILTLDNPNLSQVKKEESYREFNVDNLTLQELNKLNNELIHENESLEADLDATLRVYLTIALKKYSNDKELTGYEDTKKNTRALYDKVTDWLTTALKGNLLLDSSKTEKALDPLIASSNRLAALCGAMTENALNKVPTEIMKEKKRWEAIVKELDISKQEMMECVDDYGYFSSEYNIRQWSKDYHEFMSNLEVLVKEHVDNFKNLGTAEQDIILSKYYEATNNEEGITDTEASMKEYLTLYYRHALKDKYNKENSVDFKALYKRHYGHKAYKNDEQKKAEEAIIKRIGEIIESKKFKFSNKPIELKNDKTSEGYKEALEIGENTPAFKDWQNGMFMVVQYENSSYIIPMNKGEFAQPSNKYLNEKHSKLSDKQKKFIVEAKNVIEKLTLHTILPSSVHELLPSYFKAHAKNVESKIEKKSDYETLKDTFGLNYEPVILEFYKLLNQDPLFKIRKQYIGENYNEYKRKIVEEFKMNEQIPIQDRNRINTYEEIEAFNHSVIVRNMESHTRAVSKDLSKTIPLFIENAIMYKTRKDLENNVKIFIKALKGKDVKLEKSKSVFNLSKDTDWISGEDSIVVSKLEKYYKMVIQDRASDVMKGGETVQKIGNVMTWVNLGLNYASASKNILTGEAMMLTRALGKKSFSMTEYLKAKKDFAIALANGSILSDIYKTTASSKVSAIAKQFTMFARPSYFIGGELKGQMKGKVVKGFDTTSYALIMAGEYEMQVSVTMMVIRSHKVIKRGGETKFMTKNEYLEMRLKELGVKRMNVYEEYKNKLVGTKEKLKEQEDATKQIYEEWDNIKGDLYEWLQFDKDKGYIEFPYAENTEHTNTEFSKVITKAIRTNHRIQGVYDISNKGTWEANPYMRSFMFRFRRWMRERYIDLYGSRGGMFWGSKEVYDEGLNLKSRGQFRDLFRILYGSDFMEQAKKDFKALPKYQQWHRLQRNYENIKHGLYMYMNYLKLLRLNIKSQNKDVIASLNNRIAELSYLIGVQCLYFMVMDDDNFHDKSVIGKILQAIVGMHVGEMFTAVPAIGAIAEGVGNFTNLERLSPLATYISRLGTLAFQLVAAPFERETRTRYGKVRGEYKIKNQANKILPVLHQYDNFKRVTKEPYRYTPQSNLPYYNKIKKLDRNTGWFRDAE